MRFGANQNINKHFLNLNQLTNIQVHMFHESTHTHQKVKQLIQKKARVKCLAKSLILYTSLGLRSRIFKDYCVTCRCLLLRM